MALAVMVVLLVGAGVFVCRSAYQWRAPVTEVAGVHAPADLPPLLGPSSYAAANQADVGGGGSDDVVANPMARDVEPAIANVPEPGRASAEKKPAARASSAPVGSPSHLAKLARLQGGPANLPSALGALPAETSNRYDRFTAIYDLSAHTVYLPNGARLEAHSGLGDRLDDPRHVDEQDRGATPPHVYDLTLREQLFHGVQALRLNPVGGAGEIFGRAGLLAHTYLLGPNGDSNGCVSFKDYDAFLQAFENGTIKQLAVVARMN